jgi:hypothetical protein
MDTDIFFSNKNEFLEKFFLKIKQEANKFYISFLSYIIILIILFSCSTDRNKRAYEYFPDMVYSETYETYAPNPIFIDGKTAQLPVKGTIPRHMVPYQYPDTRDGLKIAGLELINPLELNEENLNRGKIEYNIFCANCHGLDGKGDGNLYASGKYPSEPPSLITEAMLSRPDGEYYHIMTIGSAIMEPFASLIRPEDKWKIILYIKNDLARQNIKTEP